MATDYSTKAVNFRLQRNLRGRLEKEAARQQRSMSNLITVILTEKLEELEAEAAALDGTAGAGVLEHNLKDALPSPQSNARENS